MSITALLDPFTSVLTIWNSIGGKYSSVSAFRNQKDMESVQIVLDRLASSDIMSRQDISRISEKLKKVLLKQSQNEKELRDLKKKIEEVGIPFHSLVETLNSMPFGRFLVNEGSRVVKVRGKSDGEAICYDGLYGVINNLSELTDCDILSSAFVPANKKIIKSLVQDPNRYLWHVTNLKEGLFRPSDSAMVPVLFNIDHEQFLGWQKEEIIRSEFGIEVDNSKWDLKSGDIINPVKPSIATKSNLFPAKNMSLLNDSGRPMDISNGVYRAKFLYRCYTCSYLLGVEVRGNRENVACRRCGEDILIGKEIIPSLVLN